MTGGVAELLTNVGAPAGVDITGDWKTWHGGPGDFWVWGNIGGGEVHLEASLDQNAPLTVCQSSITNTSPTASGVVNFNLNHGTFIRAVLTGSTLDSSGVYAKVN